ncbi:unnamed protein product [Cylicocyclus nassatus]|uniref:Uncharacterized protein n=1 Tax=Cylicocyclus nassatus TaxID=53992 RepID=A0AA36MBM9_CYLNA|nr:unnamed protein product [Cylicocyclus nassatus]
MTLFYFHLPWIINEKEYNCSSRSYAEWKSRGSVNIYQGTYFAVAGTIFLIIYALCLAGMYRGLLLKKACYKLMFFNGFVDIFDLMLCSYIIPYFHFTGAVFCTSMAFNWFSGHLAYSLWFGASFNCTVLALNRFVEMIPVARQVQFLFRGNLLYMWMLISAFYMIIVWFTIRPLLFNSVASAYIGSPMITDSPSDHDHYTSLYLKTFTGLTGILYIALEFLPVPQCVVIAAHVIWQLSHGIHGIIYLCFNVQIRQEVASLLFKSKRKTGSIKSSHRSVLGTSGSHV